MSMAADRQYLAVSRHIATDENVASKPQDKIAGAVGKPNARVLACKLIIAATITCLLLGAAVARAGDKDFFPQDRTLHANPELAAGLVTSCCGPMARQCAAHAARSRRRGHGIRGNLCSVGRSVKAL